MIVNWIIILLIMILLILTKLSWPTNQSLILCSKVNKCNQKIVFRVYGTSIMYQSYFKEYYLTTLPQLSSTWWLANFFFWWRSGNMLTNACRPPLFSTRWSCSLNHHWQHPECFWETDQMTWLARNAAKEEKGVTTTQRQH